MKILSSLGMKLQKQSNLFLKSGTLCYARCTLLWILIVVAMKINGRYLLLFTFIIDDMTYLNEMISSGRVGAKLY